MRRRPSGPVALVLCACLGAGFSLDRPRHTDLSHLDWSAAFSGLCATLAREYPFSAWKGLDWPAIERELSPRVARAAAAGDRPAFYLALRELVWRLRDGHARLIGDDGGLRRRATGGSFGLSVIELDDGRVLVAEISAGGPADRAGLRFGAEIRRWNDVPIGAAIAALPVLWSERPPATAEGHRLAQARLLARAPVGTRAAVAFRNRGAPIGASDASGASDVTRELIAVAAPPETSQHLRGRDLLLGRPVQAHALAGGAGYVRLGFEAPTPRMPLPGEVLRRALARFAEARLPGVVVDVRGNRGGLDVMVAPLAAPLLREARLYEQPGIYRASRGRFEADPRQAITVLPEPPLYRGRVAVLIDADTVSAGEAIPFLLKGLPQTAVFGFHATHGSFGIGQKSISLPAGFEIVFPHAQSLDAAGGVEVDGDSRGHGGVQPDHRLPLTEAVVDRWLGHGVDVALEEAIRFVRGEPLRYGVE